jgi:hypothetical protein
MLIENLIFCDSLVDGKYLILLFNILYNFGLQNPFIPILLF